MKRFIAIAATAICCMGNEFPAQAGVKTTEDVMTGVSRHVLAIDSNTTVANSIGIQKSATIIIRCKGTELDAYVHTPTYNGIFYRSNPVVSTRWDGGKITSGSWGASKGGDAIRSTHALQVLLGNLQLLKRLSLAGSLTALNVLPHAGTCNITRQTSKR